MGLDQLQDLLTDLIVSELARLKHPAAGPMPLSLTPQTAIGADDGLALTSLELFDLATAVSVQLGLREQNLDRELMQRRRSVIGSRSRGWHAPATTVGYAFKPPAPTAARRPVCFR